MIRKLCQYEGAKIIKVEQAAELRQTFKIMLQQVLKGQRQLPVKLVVMILKKYGIKDCKY